MLVIRKGWSLVKPATQNEVNFWENIKKTDRNLFDKENKLRELIFVRQNVKRGRNARISFSLFAAWTILSASQRLTSFYVFGLTKRKETHSFNIELEHLFEIRRYLRQQCPVAPILCAMHDNQRQNGFRCEYLAPRHRKFLFIRTGHWLDERLLLLWDVQAASGRICSVNVEGSRPQKGDHTRAIEYAGPAHERWCNETAGAQH